MRGILVGLGLMGLFGCTTPAAETVAGGSGGAGGGATSRVDSGGGGAEPVTEAPACEDYGACSDQPDAFELLFEAPPSVELRQATADAVLGYDAGANQYVLYSVRNSSDKVALPAVTEARRFAPEVDRVLIGTGGSGLACTGASCDLWYVWDFLQTGEMAAPIPGELDAQTVAGACVAGRGIACFEGVGAKPEWIWKANPDALAHPIIALARLDIDVFVASDGVGPAMIIDKGHVFPLDLGTTSPIVSLVANPNSRQFWSGLTASNELVIGDAGRGAICSPSAQVLTADGLVGVAMVSGDSLLRDVGTCQRFALPEGIIDVASTQCVAYVKPMAISARRVYGMPINCAYD